MRPRMPWLMVRVAPFEAAIAAVIFVSVVLVMVGWGPPDPAESVLPDWLRWVFNAAYGLAGLMILVGLIWPRGDVEGSGLVLLVSALVARGAMLGYLQDWQVQAVTSLIYSLFFVLAAALRITVLISSGRSDVA